MSDTGELCRRLAEHTGSEARIAALEAENERLREGLRLAHCGVHGVDQRTGARAGCGLCRLMESTAKEQKS